MNFRVRRVSDDKYESSVQLNTIEELMVFVRTNGEIIVGDIFIPETETYEIGITIYDDYIE